MGNSTNPYGKPVISATPTQTAADMQAVADFADEFANVRVGTQSERLALTADELRPGMLFSERDTGVVTMWTGSAWKRRAIASGVVQCPAAGGGGVTPIFWSDLIDVSFPAGVFTAAPQVFVQTIGPTGQVPLNGSVESITATGCKVRGMRISAVPGSTFSVQWVAVQP